MPEDREARIARLARYRWQPGQSGNPSGKPKNDPLLKAKRLARESLTEALATAVAIMRSEPDPDIKLKAARFIYTLADEARALTSEDVPASEREVDVTPLVRQLSSEALARLVAGGVDVRQEGEKASEPAALQQESLRNGLGSSEQAGTGGSGTQTGIEGGEGVHLTGTPGPSGASEATQSLRQDTDPQGAP